MTTVIYGPMLPVWAELTIDLVLPPDDANDATITSEPKDLDAPTVEDRTVIIPVPDALLFSGFTALADAALVDEIDAVTQLERRYSGFDGAGSCAALKRVASGLLAARATADLVAQEDA